MSESTSTLLIKLLSTGDLSALMKGKDQSEALKASLEGLKKVLGMFGIGMNLAALVAGTKAAIDFGSAINDLSIQAGISTQAFQSLAYVAEAAGVKQDELGGALNILARNLAQAADGATKQNQAIADLGLNTAELLAMPVEQQIEAIAKAYTNAADKGKAWADVISLLGKNSAKVREILQELGAKGFAGIEKENPLILSDGDIARLDRYGDFWAKLWREAKTVSAEIVARPVDALMTLNNPAMGYAGFHAMGMDAGKPAEAGSSAEEIKAQMAATIQGSDQMISAGLALDKALAETYRAFEQPAEAAKRLRLEYYRLTEAANKLAENKYDSASQLESVKLRTEAAKVASQAFAEDVKLAKEKKQYAADEAEMQQRFAQQATKLLPVNQQLVQAKAHEADLTQRLAALSEASLTFRQDHLKIEGQILTVKTEIVALEEKEAGMRVEQMTKTQDLQNQREAIALAAVEADFNSTDAEKWEEKRGILQRSVEAQERYIANMRRMANDPALPQGARDKAANAAGSGDNALAGTQQQMGAQGPNPKSFIENFSANLTKLRSQWGTFQQQMASGLSGQISNAVQSVSNGIHGWLSGAMNFKQGLTSIWQGFAQSAEQAFVDMLAKYAMNKVMMFAIDQAIAAKGFLLSAAMAAKSLILWLPSAIAASISSFGLAAAIGAAAVIGIVASGGFEDGGFTGGSEGRPAGVVHGQEFVWSAPAVRNIGVGNLERAHQAAMTGGSGVSSGVGASGGSGTIILAMSPEDVARSQRGYVDARVYRMSGRTPRARYAS